MKINYTTHPIPRTPETQTFQVGDFVELIENYRDICDYNHGVKYEITKIEKTFSPERYKQVLSVKGISQKICSHIVKLWGSED